MGINSLSDLIAPLAELAGPAAYIYLVLGAGFIFPFLGILLILMMVIERFKGSRSGGPGFNLAMQSAEIVYGLFNPIAFLLFVLPSIPPILLGSSTRAVAFASGVLVLLMVWFVRSSKSLASAGDRNEKSIRTSACWIAIGGVIFHWGLFGIIWSSSGKSAFGHYFFWQLSINFLVAIALVSRFFGAQAARFYWPVETIRSSRPVLIATFILLIPSLTLAYIVAGRGAPKRNAESYLNQHASEIDRLAAQFGISQDILASTLRVSIASSPSWKPHVERGLMTLWLADAHSHTSIAKSYDISIGPAQIKPTTVQTALLIGMMNQTENCDLRFYGSKEYRSAWRPDSSWCLNERISLPMGWTALPTNQQIIETLMTDQGAIEITAFILSLYSRQWSKVAIHDEAKPLLLGTLFQIGFEKSRPHPSPHFSGFGERVGQAVNARRSAR